MTNGPRRFMFCVEPKVVSSNPRLFREKLVHKTTFLAQKKVAVETTNSRPKKLIETKNSAILRDNKAQKRREG